MGTIRARVPLVSFVVDDPRVQNALDVQTLHLDCGYDSNITTEYCKTLGLTDIVCAKKPVRARPKITKPFTLGLCWLVERTTPGCPASASSTANRQFFPQRLDQIAVAVAVSLTVNSS